VAQAATLTLPTVTIGPKTMNWVDSLNVSKFDPLLGVLTGVTITIGGSINGFEKIESFDTTAQVILTSVSANLTVERPDTTPLMVLKPGFSTTDSFTAYDGIWDWAGTSGIGGSGEGRPFSASDPGAPTTFSAASDLALFTGTGNITLPVIAQGFSAATGSANLTSWFKTAASADVTVVYDYKPVPEPSSLLVMGTGLLGLIGGLRRRRN